MNKRSIISLVVLVVLAILLVLIRVSYVPDSASTSPASNQQTPNSTVIINDTAIHVTIADTSPKRQQGLSGVQELPEDSGLLLVFDTSDTNGIWMKDMLFSLDIIWFDEDKRIVHIEQSVAPETYDHIFRPESAARYVLEVHAGFVEKHGISVGDTFSFQ